MRQGMRLLGFAGVVVVALLSQSCSRVSRNSNAESTGEPVPGRAAADTSVSVSVATLDSDIWYSIEAGRLTPGPPVDAFCCPKYPGGGPPTTVVWASPIGESVRLLVLDASSSPPSEPRLPRPDNYYRDQADGGLWTFESFGIEPEELKRLADAVYWTAVEGFVLPNPMMAKLAEGPRGVGSLTTQVYAGVGGRVTLSVGDYRGQLDGLARLQSVTRRKIAGRPAFELISWPDGMGDQVTELVWPSGGGRWALVHIPAVFGAEVDAIADAIVASGPPASDPVIAPAGGTQYYVADVLVTESEADGPMIAFVLEGPVPAGGDVPIAGWDWSDVPDAESQPLMGRTWGGPWRVVGTWNGTTFTMSQRPVPVPAVDVPPFVRPTDGCDESSFSPTRDQLALLGRSAVGSFADNVNTWDGRCGIIIEAFVDSTELRDLLAPFAAEIEEYKFTLQPID